MATATYFLKGFVVPAFFLDIVPVSFDRVAGGRGWRIRKRRDREPPAH